MLTAESRTFWFTSRDLSACSLRPTARCPLGPFSSAETLDQFVALAQADCAALASVRWAPDKDTFKAGYARLCAANPSYLALTSRRTRGCCCSVHACGEKVGENATLMKRTAAKLLREYDLDT